jgi:hypothetical protein
MSLIVPLAQMPAVAGASVKVLGIEVTQTIQNLAHDVPLIAGKSTVARVYVQPAAISQQVKVRGEIVVSRGPGVAGTFVASVNEVKLIPGGAHPSLEQQRRSLGSSLQFILPPELCKTPGPFSVKLNKIATLDGQSIPFNPASAATQVELVSAPVLHVHCVGLRYQFNGAGVSPQAVHFSYLRSFLGRAYPVSAVSWSQIVIDADVRLVPPFSGPLTPPPERRDPRWEELLAIAQQQVTNIRAKDVEGGADRRTHYYGLIADDAGFFRGAAVDVPTTPSPDIVAVGPAGKAGPGFWDDDASYADWYGAHEIAHTFGRFHPGFCDQSHDDHDFPFADGRISNSQLDHIGLDVGDPALGLPLRVMTHEKCHDVMTYCADQWMSAYTYKGILERLEEEEAAFPPEIA